ncbi:hypothetical protein BRD19_09860 [Halobacteriales archaeon SW_7_65_23]|nr:MAG: hypothetical protein BRD19_09860 [Halobacteriales archaeon SW_7_65_23]
MNAYTYVHTAAAAVFLLASCLPGLAAAEQNETADVDQEDPVVEIDLDPLIELLEDLVDIVQNWPEKLGDLLRTIFYRPFQELVQSLLSFVYTALTTTPSVQHTPAVQEVHGQVLLVTYLLATLVFMSAGILHMTGPVVGVSFADVRIMLPRVVVALVFATLSLPLLELAVDLTNALNRAFAPGGLRLSLQELLGLGSGLILAVVVKSVALLALVVLFILRAVYILFVAAISPLLALMWSVPKLRRYANTFIAGWFAALMFAPLDLLVLRFSLAMMRGTGGIGLDSLANWILGIASLVLLLLVPLQVWTASQTILGQGYRTGNVVKERVASTRERIGNDENTRPQGQRPSQRTRRRHSREDRGEWR